MKSPKFIYLLMAGLALTLTVGCRHKGGAYQTPLPGSVTGQSVEPGPGGMLNNGGGIGAGGGVGNQGYSVGPGHPGWNQNSSAFAAQTVYFDYDSAAIKSSEHFKIQDVAADLRSNPSHAVLVEGNCDERGTEEYNRALGERRALAVREALIAAGIAPDRVDTISYGEDKPVDPGHNEEAWKKNRRADFVLLTPP